MRAEVCLSLALVTAVAASVPTGYYQQYWWTAAQRPGPYWEGDRPPASDRSSEMERLWRPDHEPSGGQTRHRHLTHGQAAALGGYLSSRRLTDTDGPRQTQWQYGSQGRQSGEHGLEGRYATHGRQRQRDDSREDIRTPVRTHDRGNDRWNQRESQDSREHTWNQDRAQDSREDTRNQGRSQDSGEDRWNRGRTQDTRDYSWNQRRVENSGEYNTRTPDRMQDTTEDTRTRGRAQYDRESIWSQGRTQDSREEPRNRSQDSREDTQNQDRSQDGREDTQNQDISQDSREDARLYGRAQDSREEAGADGAGQNSASVEQHTSTGRGPYGPDGGQTRYGGGQLGPERRGAAATRDDLRARQAPWWSDRLLSAHQDRWWDAPLGYPPAARYSVRRGNYDDDQSDEDRRPGGRWAARDNSDEDSDERRHYWLG